MHKRKVVVIGGGSSYTPELIEGFLTRYDSFPLDELVLVDVEAGLAKVTIIAELAKRMIAKAKRDIHVSYTLDRQSALRDATFVITQLRIGQLEARILDEKCCNALDHIGQETTGAGGMFNALRTIPILLSIVEEVKQLCPDAWIINFANPSGMISEAVLKYGNFKRFIGLCNVPINLHHAIASLMDLDAQDIRLEIAGLNHFIYVRDVFHRGNSIMPAVLNRYLDADTPFSMRNIDGIAWSSALIKGLQALPCPYHQYYYYKKEELQKQLASFHGGKVRGEIVREVETALFELYQDESLDEKPAALALRGGALYSDAACNLIVSLYLDKGDIQYVNTRNGTTLLDLDPDCCIEVAAKITKEGPQPIPLKPLTPPLRGPIQLMKAFEQKCIEAAYTGSYVSCIAALNLNPLVDSDRSAHALFASLYDAHQTYLPHIQRKEDPS